MQESQISEVAELAKCRDCPAKCDECRPYYALWSLNKHGSQRRNLNTADSILKENGFMVIDQQLIRMRMCWDVAATGR